MIRWLEISANRRALAYILFSAVVLGAMFFLGIMPARQQIAEAEQQTARLKRRIEQQEIFHPLYRRLQEELADEDRIDRISGRLPAEQGTGFTIDNVSGILSGMAESAGIAESSFSPAPASMSRGSDRLLVHGRMEGRYSDFRKFLTDLVITRDFEGFEVLTVQSGTRFPAYQLQMWVTVE